MSVSIARAFSSIHTCVAPRVLHFSAFITPVSLIFVVLHECERVLSYIETLVGHVMCLKQCITSAFATFANATSTTNTFDNVLSIGNV